MFFLFLSFGQKPVNHKVSQGQVENRKNHHGHSHNKNNKKKNTEKHKKEEKKNTSNKSHGIGNGEKNSKKKKSQGKHSFVESSKENSGSFGAKKSLDPMKTEGDVRMNFLPKSSTNILNVVPKILPEVMKPIPKHSSEDIDKPTPKPFPEILRPIPKPSSEDIDKPTSKPFPEILRPIPKPLPKPFKPIPKPDFNTLPPLIPLPIPFPDDFIKPLPFPGPIKPDKKNKKPVKPPKPHKDPMEPPKPLPLPPIPIPQPTPAPAPPMPMPPPQPIPSPQPIGPDSFDDTKLEPFKPISRPSHLEPWTSDHKNHKNKFHGDQNKKSTDFNKNHKSSVENTKKDKPPTESTPPTLVKNIDLTENQRKKLTNFLSIIKKFEFEEFFNTPALNNPLIKEKYTTWIKERGIYFQNLNLRSLEESLSAFTSEEKSYFSFLLASQKSPLLSLEEICILRNFLAYGKQHHIFGSAQQTHELLKKFLQYIVNFGSTINPLKGKKEEILSQKDLQNIVNFLYGFLKSRRQVLSNGLWIGGETREEGDYFEEETESRYFFENRFLNILKSFLNYITII